MFAEEHQDEEVSLVPHISSVPTQHSGGSELVFTGFIFTSLTFVTTRHTAS